MQQNVFEVLYYLVDHAKRLGSEHKERQTLLTELQDQGFHLGDIYVAFRWLSALESFVEHLSKNNTLSTQSMRVFTPLERLRLDSECYGYLLFLEQAKVLDAQTREIIIERALATETDDLTLERFKRIILIVLMQQNSIPNPIWEKEVLIMTDDIKKRFH
jgi:Smg protein